MSLTENDVSNASYRNREYAQSTVAKSMAYLIDADRAKRLADRLCSWCFYFRSGRIAGQAFTDWTCKACGRVSTYHCTAVPYVCTKCSQDYDLCVDCNGDIHLRVRRGKKIPAVAL